MKFTLCFVTGVALLLQACTPRTETASVSSIIDKVAVSRIDSTLNHLVSSDSIVGVSALIFEKGQEVYFNTFGYADRENLVLMDRNAIVQIFSMTKPITGTALMQLYEKGAFQLDDPLTQYAPEFDGLQVFTGVDESGNLLLEPLNRPITIRDLTRHTAGFVNSNTIPVLGDIYKEANGIRRQKTLSELAAGLGQVPLMYQPGTQWAYGPSVDMQAFLVERLSGQPFDQYIKTNILDPLGMIETRYVVPEEDLDRFAATYRREDGVLNRVPDENAKAFNTKDWPIKPGGYGLTSTLDDYMTFARMLVNEGSLNEKTILKPETVKLMATSHLDDSVTERMWLPSKGQVGFGIDFAVRVRPPASADENPGVVGEFFWDGAASTMFWVDPVNELTAVLFVQLLPFDRVGLHKGFRKAVYGPYTPPKK